MWRKIGFSLKIRKLKQTVKHGDDLIMIQDACLLMDLVKWPLLKTIWMHKNILMYHEIIYIIVLWSYKFLIHIISNRIMTQSTVHKLQFCGWHIMQKMNYKRYLQHNNCVILKKFLFKILFTAFKKTPSSIKKIALFTSWD